MKVEMRSRMGMRSRSESFLIRRKVRMVERVLVMMKRMVMICIRSMPRKRKSSRKIEAKTTR